MRSNLTLKRAATLLAIFLLLGGGVVNGQATSPCDLNSDGTINQTDFALAVNMALGSTPCVAVILGPGVCNVVVVQRVANAMSGGNCASVGGSHRVMLTWNASASPDVAGYNVYRATASPAGFVKLNATLNTGTTYTDAAVSGGQTFYYVTTAVTSAGLESDYSNVASATVPVP